MRSVVQAVGGAMRQASLQVQQCSLPVRVLMVVALVILLLPWRMGVVRGESMDPTLKSGSLFLLDRAYYRLHPLRRGDVVVLRRGGETLVKRVMAAGGDRFLAWQEYSDGVTSEPITAEVARTMSKRRTEYVGVAQVRVPTGALFVVGDGYSSEDSRTFGLVHQEDVLGRVVSTPSVERNPGLILDASASAEWDRRLASNQ